MTPFKKNHILDLIFCINKVLFYFVNHAMHALYSAKQRRYQKFTYQGKTIQGKPFTATELTKQQRKSVWHDGVYIGKVEQWHEVQDIVKLKKKNIKTNQVLL